MTTQAEAIRDLIAKIEAGERLLWHKAAAAVGIRPENRHIDVIKAYHGSLDAAMALHHEMLSPNCYWWVERRPDGLNQSGVAVGNLGKTFQATAETPARAWLLAILKAYLAEMEAGD